MIFTRVVAERDVNERGVCNLAENGFAFHRNEVDALLSVAYRVSYERENKKRKGIEGGKKSLEFTMIFVF